MDPMTFVKRSQVKEIVRRGAPNFNGNKVYIKTLKNGSFDPYDNYWSSGHRSYYTKIDLNNLRPTSIPEPAFGSHPVPFDVESHCIVVQHNFAGTKQFCTIWARVEDQGFEIPSKPVMFVKP